MPEDLPERTAVTSADKDDLLRVRVSMMDDMGQHLVVKKLIFFSDLDDPVKYHHMSEKWIFDDSDILEFTFSVVENPRDLLAVLYRGIEIFFIEAYHPVTSLY